MKKRLLIMGIGGHGKVVADVAKQMGAWSQIAFLDDRYGSYDGEVPFGYELLGRSKDVLNFIDDSEVFIAYGDNSLRGEAQERIEEAGGTVATLVHPAATVGDRVSIARGTVVMAASVINSYTEIGRGCIINTGATVDHDNVIGDYVHLSPGANLAGSVRVGARSWIGIGATVSNDISITENVMVGAGGVVVKSIQESGVYIGVPVFKFR